MTRMAGRLADRLLSLVVPGIQASAAVQTKCVQCGMSTRSKFCKRDCAPDGCGKWVCTTGCPC